jgi:methylated-DNA-protein-cysteine methyltransferase-like protein
MKSDLYDRIFALVKKIPKGRVATYGDLADYVETGPRVVGYAMNASHKVPGVPAHRVVNRNGLLTGKSHFSNPYEMETRLKAEGVKVIDDKVAEFDRKRWNPNVELKKLTRNK